jgi:chromosome segregation protein
MIKEQEITNLEEKKAQLENDLSVLMTSINNTKQEKEQGEEELSDLTAKYDARVLAIGEDIKAKEEELQAFIVSVDDKKKDARENLDSILTAINKAGYDLDAIKESNEKLIYDAKDEVKAIRELADKDMAIAINELTEVKNSKDAIILEIGSFEVKRNTRKEEVLELNKNVELKKVELETVTNKISEANNQLLAIEPEVKLAQRKVWILKEELDNAKEVVAQKEYNESELVKVNDELTLRRKDLAEVVVTQTERDDFIKAKMQFTKDVTALNAREEIIKKKYEVAGLKY